MSRNKETLEENKVDRCLFDQSFLHPGHPLEDLQIFPRFHKQSLFAGFFLV